MRPLTLTSVREILVGHAHDLEAATGSTVVLCPPGTACAVDQRGGAPGTRETDLLRPGRLVGAVDAVVLAGGSAFGLAAADGVVAYLEERGRGFPAPAGPVPIVPAAILYDLDIGSACVRPDRSMGYAACRAATGDRVPEGSVGAGAGCRVGMARGPRFATKSGIGSAGRRLEGGRVVAALFAVNALGDVLDPSGRVIAGLRAEGAGRWASSEEWLLSHPPTRRLPASHTVIGVVATNARLSRDELALVAAMAHDGIARAVRPSHTLLDGDTIFALATGEVAGDAMTCGIAAAEVTAAAIRNAVLEATSLGGIPARGEEPV